ncbi:unnamed protein product [Schistosoma mattheei]|uniref:Uncharacterized protein n=1 Tax=Schistosoma mattheei TaxID=31246 RepID=A0A183NKS7_9TREM|nr:unnamed protein product [Schistosoma mattheei]
MWQKNCRLQRSYDVGGCGWIHNTLLHGKQEEQRDSNSNTYINTQLCTEERVRHVQRQLAFGIVPVLIENGLSFDDVSVDNTLLCNKRWKGSQRLTTAFLNRWIREYLIPQTRDKWLNVQENLRSGDIASLSNIEAIGRLWLKDIVEKVSYGPDGQVRTVKVRTADEEIIRDVRSLCLLEQASYLTKTTQDDERGVRFGGV